MSFNQIFNRNNHLLGFFPTAFFLVEVMMGMSVSGTQERGIVRKHLKPMKVELLPSQFTPLENKHSLLEKTEL